MAFPRRLRLLLVLTSVVFGIIWLRMIQLQTVEREACAAIAEAKRQTTRTLKPPRGRIRDRDGALLAWDAPIRQVAIVGAEWKTRARRRCPTCGTIHFYDPDRGFRVRRCACRTPAREFERMPPPDLGPLAAALGLTVEQLETLADRRIARIDQLAEGRRKASGEGARAAFLVDDEVEQYRADLLHRPYVYPGGEGKPLADVTEEVVRLIELDEVGRYRGFRIRTALRRRYDPEGPAGQLLGYVTGVEDREELEALRDAYSRRVDLETRIGRAGLELACDEYLVGENGFQTLALDEEGAFSVTVREERPHPGMELELTLTKDACRKADAVLEHWGTAAGYVPRSQPSGGFVAMRADTGEIVAWGELPRVVFPRDLQTLYDEAEDEAVYDGVLGQWVPGPKTKLADGETLEEFQRRICRPAPRRLSRVNEIAVEPGSTLKVFVGLALLDGIRRMPPGTPLPLETRGRYFACHSLLVTKPGCHAHRDVDFVGAIEVSCNKYFAWSLRDFPGYWEVFQHSVPRFLERFGFGQPSRVDVAGESPGLFLRDWVDFDPAVAIEEAARRLAADDEPIHLKLDLAAGLPDRVAGRGAERLSAGLVAAVRQAARAVGARQALLGVQGGDRRYPYRDLDFRLLLPPPGPEGASAGAAKKAEQALLEALAPLGVDHAVEVEGVPGALALGFRLVYHDRIGREAGAPAPLLEEDARNLAIGQGPVTTTPLQMVRAVAAIANGGILVTPHVVAAADGEPFVYPRKRLDVPREDLDRVRAGMRAVVSGGGTARGTGLKHLPGQVYGKTGTSQPGGWWTPGSGPPEGVWHHWFVGFHEAPGRPPLAFACVLHARSEAAAGLTAANAVHDFLAWWVR